MSRVSRLALVTLATVLMLGPLAALHPVLTHLYAAGLSNLSIEASHPWLLVLSALALVSAIPALGFLVSLFHAARGLGHLRALAQSSAPASLDELHYRSIPSDAVVVFTAGVLRPATFVTVGAECSLSQAELRAALLHEQAHQQSQDVLWRLLLRAVGGGFSFVPWIRQVIDAETLRTECQADDYAIRGGAHRRELFEAIVAASTPPASPLAAGLTDANVELRLMRLVHPETPLPGASARSFIALAAATALPAVIVHVIAVAATVCASNLIA